MYSDSSCPNADSADTVLQDIGTEGEDEDFVISSNVSRTPSPETMLAGTRSEWLPTVVRSGYFVFPDPFSSGQRISSSPERKRSYATTSSEDEGGTTEDESEMEDYESTPPESVSLDQGAEQDTAPSLKKEANQFLPLLTDEPNYSRNPTLNRGLEKINRRLTKTKSCAEEQSTQSSKTNPILGIHPALRQAESHPAIDNEALAALKAEVKQLKANVKALKRLATSRDNRQAEFLRHVGMNQDSLAGGWEQMRNELFQIKVMQEQLRRSVSTQRNMDGRW